MKKLNNKGFSLVELIIVIAIMVILVIAIAPQYLKFVGNSRIGTDVQTAQAMVTAIDVAIADQKTPFTAESGQTLAAMGIVFADVEGIDAEPASKLEGSWKVFGDDAKGVTGIILTIPAGKANAGTYEVFPNPDNNAANSTLGTSKGLNELKN